MKFTGVSDLASHLQGLRTNAQLKQRLDTLSKELATGQSADLTRALRGDTGRLMQIDRQLSLLGSLQSSIVETQQVMSAMQTTLNGLDSARSQLIESLLPQSPAVSEPRRQEMSEAAEGTFRQVVGLANTRNADRSLFAGTDTDVSALADADTMLADISIAVNGLGSMDDIKAALDTWFDDPAGGFSTIGYLGSAERINRPLGSTTTIELPVTADDAAFKDTLKAAAMAIVASDPGTALTEDEAAQLLEDAGVALLTAAGSIAQTQSRLGAVEASAEEANVRLGAEETSLSIARNELVAIDPFDTVSALQEAESQLQTHYAVTARLSALSLTGYLR